MEEKIDRRKQRTRRMLRDALMSLILERGFDALTIQDITERADLRRATFYLHYRDKDELLLTILQETVNELVSEIEPYMKGDVLAGKTKVEPYRVTFRHIAEHRDLYRIILSGGGSAAIAERIQEYLASVVMNSLKSVPARSLQVPKDVLANFIAGAEISLIAWWLKVGQQYSADDMAHMVHRLILNGAKDAFELKLAEG
jgi:AcrR family transcriptional regulator